MGNKRIYNRWPGYSVEDCSCKYCLFFIGIKHREIICWKDVCVCKSEIHEALLAGRIKSVWK